MTDLMSDERLDEWTGRLIDHPNRSDGETHAFHDLFDHLDSVLTEKRGGA